MDPLSHAAMERFRAACDDDHRDGGLSDGEPRWPSTEARQRAIDANDVWTARWYPQTPVGFCDAAAPTLAELLEMMRSA